MNSTNNANDLQNYIETITVSHHVASDTQVAQSGIFGLGEGFSILITLATFMLIAYFIGCVNNKKKNDTFFTKINAQYIMNFFRALSSPFFAVANIYKFKTVCFDRADSKYHTISLVQFRDAEQWADGEMRNLGVTFKEAYKDKAFDCENFARLKAQLMTLWLSRNVENSEGKGFPVGTVGLLRHGKDLHEMVHASLSDFTKYFISEPYPDNPKSRVIESAEEHSISFDVM